MNNIEHIAEELFNKIRSRFEKVTIADESGKVTDDPDSARFFNFDFITQDGTNHGEVTVNIIEDNNLKIIFNKDMNLDSAHEDEWQQLLRSLRNFAKRNMLSFDVRDIARSNLSKRDIKQTAKSQSAFKSHAAPVNESIQWSGTTRTSIQEFGTTRLIVRHTEAIDSERPGSRSRKIESMFVETDQGERFRMPYNRLSLGRAMAQHLAHGGKIYDEAGQHIQEMAEEMGNLSFFVRNTRHRQFEDAVTTGMVESAIERYQLLRQGLQKLTRTRGYQEFAENFVPDSGPVAEIDIDQLKERFVKKMFDDRLTAALPYVYRAYQTREVGEQRYLDEFENWTETVNEAPESVDFSELAKLMSKPIRAGHNGIDAVAAIGNIIDNDELNDLISQTAQVQGQDADVRSEIDSWFRENYPEYTGSIPDQISEPESQPNNNSTRTEDYTQAFENLKRLAGLLKK